LEEREKGRKVAGPTGLEPATSGVTGLRSNQLSYDPEFRPRTVAAGRDAEYTETVIRRKRESSSFSCSGHGGGRYRDRTDDLLRVKPVGEQPTIAEHGVTLLRPAEVFWRPGPRGPVADLVPNGGKQTLRRQT
jgi:hypothetical protein